jgi:hypothetical protein
LLLLNGDTEVPAPTTVDPTGTVEVKVGGIETTTVSENPEPTKLPSPCKPLSMMSVMMNDKFSTGDEKVNVIS